MYYSSARISVSHSLIYLESTLSDKEHCQGIVRRGSCDTLVSKDMVGHVPINISKFISHTSKFSGNC